MTPSVCNPAASAARWTTDIDVRSEILTPDGAVRVVADPMSDVRLERPVGAPGWVVQIDGCRAVIDEDDETAPEGCGGIRQPGVDPEGDLRGLAVDELDALGLQPLAERRRGRLDLDLDEAAVRSKIDGELAQDQAASADTMDGQCVEHLIGEDDAIDRGRESRGSDPQAPPRRTARETPIRRSSTSMPW